MPKNRSISAAAFGAPHLRYRIFLVAYTSIAKRQQITGSSHGNESQNGAKESDIAASHGQDASNPNFGGQPTAFEAAANANCDGCEGSNLPLRPRRQIEENPVALRANCSTSYSDESGLEGFGFFRERPRKSFAWSRLESETIAEVAAALCGVDDGTPFRVDRLKALGNSCIPQAAEWVGRRIFKVMKVA